MPHTAVHLVSRSVDFKHIGAAGSMTSTMHISARSGVKAVQVLRCSCRCWAQLNGNNMPWQPSNGRDTGMTKAQSCCLRQAAQLSMSHQGHCVCDVVDRHVRSLRNGLPKARVMPVPFLICLCLQQPDCKLLRPQQQKGKRENCGC